LSKVSVKTLQVGPIETNCYIVTCPVTKEVLVIDPGDEPERIARGLARIDKILYTHGHFDHCGGAGWLTDHFKAKTMIHSADTGLLAAVSIAASQWGFKASQPPPAHRELEDGEIILCGANPFRVLHTPGHSPGSVCLMGCGLLFSGDTLFMGSIGRTDLPGSSDAEMASSLNRIAASVPPDSLVYPGHGPATSLKRELAENPFLR